MAIYFIRKGVREGPLSIVELRARLASGAASEDDMVKIDGARRPIRIADLPGFGVEAYGLEKFEVSALHRGSPEDVYGLLDVEYASLLRRAAAGLLVDAPLVAAAAAGAGALGAFLGLEWLRAAAWFAAPIIWVAYSTALESGARAATLGKRMAGLRTLDSEGAPLGAGAALRRALIRLASLGLCGLGYAPCLFSPRKQALHDRAVGAIVIRDDE